MQQRARAGGVSCWYSESWCYSANGVRVASYDALAAVASPNATAAREATQHVLQIMLGQAGVATLGARSYGSGASGMRVLIDADLDAPPVRALRAQLAAHVPGLQARAPPPPPPKRDHLASPASIPRLWQLPQVDAVSQHFDGAESSRAAAAAAAARVANGEYSLAFVELHVGRSKKTPAGALRSASAASGGRTAVACLKGRGARHVHVAWRLWSPPWCSVVFATSLRPIA